MEIQVNMPPHTYYDATINCLRYLRIEKPVTVEFIDFFYAHLGCDAIAYRDENEPNGRVRLVAYASFSALLKSITKYLGIFLSSLF